jgi:peptide/nickel transport system permease protein
MEATNMTITYDEFAGRKKRFFVTVFLGRLFKEKPLGAFGGIIFVLLLFTGVFANFLAPHGYNEINPIDRLKAPSAKYFFGTDNVGRDVFSRIVFGARLSVIIGFSATTISIVISIVIGMLTGFAGGKVDLVIQRFVDAWMCFPGLVILIVAVSFVGPGMSQVIGILALQFGISGSRIIRGSVVATRENMYVEAARAIGASTLRQMSHHILPNIMAPIIVLYTTRVAAVILAEASMSFLGLGVPPPMPSWGGMLSGEGRSFMYMAPWLAIFPALALAVVVYGINVFGDALRDLLDPRLKGGAGRYTESNVDVKSGAEKIEVKAA